MTPTMHRATDCVDPHTPRVLSDEEIEMYVKGDPTEVARLILYSLNRLAALHVPCSKRVEAMMHIVDTDLGGVKGVTTRASYVDALIAKTKDEADFWKDMARLVKRGGVIVGTACMIAVLLYYYNQHVPASMQIDPKTVMGAFK